MMERLDKPERTRTRERERRQMQFAALSPGLTEARGDFASILLGLLRDPLMETSHNVTDIGAGNK